jgi:hypothetical protein
MSIFTQEVSKIASFFFLVILLGLTVWWIIVIMMVFGLIGLDAMLNFKSAADDPGLFLSFYGIPALLTCSLVFRRHIWR